jgi:membrane AbrB-like protein
LPPLLTAKPNRMLVHFAETMAFAVTGGMAFGLVGIPGGWLSGSILCVAAAALVGRPMHVPARLNRVIYVLIGTSLGAVVTPETLHGIASYPLSIVMLLVAMGAVNWAGTWYLRRLHGWDHVSASLGSAPGALSQCIAVATELDADLRGIVIVQTLRIAIIAVGLPATLAAFGLVTPSTRGVGGAFDPSKLDELAMLIGICTVAGWLAYRVRFPGGILFGALLASAALHGSGLIHAAMPWWAANAAMIVLGGVTGSRFAELPTRLLMRYLGAGLGSFVVSFAVAGSFAAAVIATLSLDISDAFIAFAPGSVDAMMLLALALHTDPVFVGAHHMARIFFVSVTMPILAQRAARAERRPIDESKLPPPTPDDEA